MEAGAGLLAVLFAGMVTLTIASHFELVTTLSNGTKKWRCLVCKKEFTCQGDKKMKYHVARVPGGGVDLCPNPHPEMRAHFKSEIDTLNAASTAKRAATTEAVPTRISGQPGIASAFGSVAKTEADQSILSWLAFAQLPPYIVNTELFKSMLKKTAQAGPGYLPPERHFLGMAKGGIGRLGAVLQEGLDRARAATKLKMAGLKHIKVSFVGKCCIQLA
jgi:hypothetical protein